MARTGRTATVLPPATIQKFYKQQYNGGAKKDNDRGAVWFHGRIWFREEIVVEMWNTIFQGCQTQQDKVGAISPDYDV